MFRPGFHIPFTIIPHTTHLRNKIITHIVTLISLLLVHKYRYTSPHVTGFAQEVCELKIEHNDAIYPRSVESEARNSEVGWH